MKHEYKTVGKVEHLNSSFSHRPIGIHNNFPLTAFKNWEKSLGRAHTLVSSTKLYLRGIGVLVENAHNGFQIDAKLVVIGGVTVTVQEARVAESLIRHHRR